MPLLNAENSVLLVVDFQQRLAPHMYNVEALRRQLPILVEGANSCTVPVLHCEQYPKGLGHTEQALAAVLGNTAYEKTCFNALDSPTLMAALTTHRRRQIVVVGIEAHVCVLQTVHQLLTLEYEVHIPYDCVGSRNQQTMQAALSRMNQAGAIVTSLESVLFEWLRDSRAEAFKTVSKSIR